MCSQGQFEFSPELRIFHEQFSGRPTWFLPFPPKLHIRLAYIFYNRQIGLNLYRNKMEFLTTLCSINIIIYCDSISRGAAPTPVPRSGRELWWWYNFVQLQLQRACGEETPLVTDGRGTPGRLWLPADKRWWCHPLVMKWTWNYVLISKHSATTVWPTSPFTSTNHHTRVSR